MLNRTTPRIPQVAVGGRYRGTVDGQPCVVEVMAVVDGYVMARRSGCTPFCMFAREFAVKFDRMTPRSSNSPTF